ncbi:tetratricopeptide repeat protein, partial [Candidatus Bathyarchaeota archaeon]|nr:tetratricopeptide repeat protein [Candidatus Bathyarchaeota archaeon]
EAASYFQSALRLLEEKEGELRERGRVLERLGDIKSFVGEYDDSLKYWNDALLLWKQVREKEKVSRLHRKMANVLWEEMGDAERSTEHYDKALKILEAEPESVELASLYEGMAHMYFRTGDMPKALSLAEKALELAKKLNAHEVIASSYASLGTVFFSTGEIKKSIECLERALKIALDNGYMETALRAYNNLALALWGEGEYEQRLECLEKGYGLAKKVGHIGMISWIESVLAIVCMYMGNVNKAIVLLEESTTLARKAANMPNLSGSLYLLGHAYQVLGEWDKSEQYSREALSISKTLKEFQQLAYSYRSLGWLHFDKGEYTKAREFYEQMLRVLEKAGAKYARMWYCRWAIWAYIELGDMEKAKSLINSLHKFGVEIEDKELIASVDTLKAMQYRAQKKWEESIKHFEKSLQKHEAINARRWNVYWFARMVLYEYARVYLERDCEGDREKAHNLLNQALEIFQKMGAKKDIEKVKSKVIYLETGRGLVEPELVAEVPEVILPGHVATGYADLDDLLFGGIPRNYAVIVTSPSCDERDLLIKRFLETGAKKSEATFYVTIDPGEVKILTEEFPNFYLFICNPQADKIIKDLDNVFKLKGVENLTDINIALTSALRRLSKSLKGPRRACIEIISDILLQHHTVQTRRWLSALIPELKSKGFTTLAVIDPRIHSPQEFHAIVNL